MRRMTVIAVVLGTLALPAGADGQPKEPDSEFIAAHDTYLARFKPLWLEAQQAWWAANISGTDADFDRKKRADRALVELHGDRDLFARIKALKDQGRVTDPLLRRQLDVMYRSFLPCQADPDLLARIVELESAVEQIFNTHRSVVGDGSLTENQVREILAGTTDSTAAEAAWKAYMEVGGKVEAQLGELVRLRSRQAAQLGFDNYYSMKLMLQEIDEQEFWKLFDELDALTREPFAEVKQRIDTARAARFTIPASQLRPWHYGDLFFQEAPRDEEVNLDELFKDADLVELANEYYLTLGLRCEKILARSDLFEKPGKSPHAFCSDMDRSGDVRVLCNLKPNLYWTDTLLHELGHALYDQHIRPDFPFVLRTASHAITTEGIALMFGAMTKNAEWLEKMLNLDPAQAQAVARVARRTLRTEKLLFARWTQVMVRFEQGMYGNPDQDLGKLWWDLKKRYQLLNPPDRVSRPDYAAKMHVLNYPVYYHSYLMGDMFAAQVRHFISRTILRLEEGERTSFYGHPKVGTYLRSRVFGYGNLHPWGKLTELATREPLTAKYFASEIAE